MKVTSIYQGGGELRRLLTAPQLGMVHIICLWLAIAKTVKISGEKNIVNFTGLSSQSESPKISIHWFWYADYGYGSDKINNKSVLSTIFLYGLIKKTYTIRA